MRGQIGGEKTNSVVLQESGRDKLPPANKHFCRFNQIVDNIAGECSPKLHTKSQSVKAIVETL